ncbi:purine phosphorylase [Dactylosporangium sp. CA-233914]|uniref:5'-methylthioadenosine/S-adenosylhomocysteine nucleosidase family protein n=1 Tax=Dactylosporangium sp. CA-233914 TaxID=3239934 RepID=UPI003D938A92
MARPIEAARRLVVLTAIDIEYAAMRRHLNDLVPRRHPAGTIFEVGAVPGAPWQVALAVTGPGNIGAGVLAERAIALFAPQALLFVGIAGALREWVALGDVVVGTRVFAYHGGRDDRSGFQHRPRSWDAAHGLEQLARHVARDDVRPEGDERPGPAVHFLPIAAGEVLLNSPSSPLARQLQGQYGDAVAIEMESAGASAAAHLNGGLPMLTVRGISDSVHRPKEEAEQAGWPLLAAQRAAAFAAGLIRRLEPEHTGAAPTAAPVVADRPAAPATVADRPAAPATVADRPAAPANVQVNSASGGAVFAVQGGDQIVHGGPR